MHGFGSLTWTTKDRIEQTYVGEFQNNLMNGHGMLKI